MAFKTPEEIFGDGTAGNPQVPIDLNAPPGFNAASRGVAFGEQVTSAIKNRTPYSLALNDEDLNTRLADFEVRGLDGAYDLGTLGPSGGGRTITKDGGAVETVSALSTQYGDDIANAHFRANMYGDTISGGVGFDAVGGQVTAISTGFLDRKPLGFAGDTIIPLGGSAATLNPGGAGAARVRLDGGDRWKLGTATDIALGYDLIEISGAGALDGLYDVTAFVSDTVATVTGFNANPAVFVADTAVTVTLYRRRFASASLSSGGPIIVGLPGDVVSALFVPNKVSALDGAGAFFAFAILYQGDSGVDALGLTADYKGTLGYDMSSAVFDPTGSGAYADIESLGLFSNRKLNPPANEVEASHVVLDDLNGTTPDARFDFTSLVFEFTVNFDFVASTPTDGDLNSGDTAAEELAGAGGLLAFVTGHGWFRVIGSRRGGVALRIVVRNLDGSLPAALPTVGSADVSLYTYQALGKHPQITVSEPANIPFSSPTVTPYAVFSAGDDVDAAAITLHCDGTDPDQCLIRGFASEGFGTGLPRERLRVTRDGHLVADGNIYTGGSVFVSSFGEFIYSVVKSRTKQINLLLAQPDTDPIAWVYQYSTETWESFVNFGRIHIPLPKLPHGGVITEWGVAVTPGNNDAGGRTPAGNRINARLYSNKYNFGANSVVQASIGANQLDDDTLTEQTMGDSGLAEAIDSETHYYIEVKAGDDAASGGGFEDLVHGAYVVFDDPGPLNY